MYSQEFMVYLAAYKKEENHKPEVNKKKAHENGNFFLSLLKLFLKIA